MVESDGLSLFFPAQHVLGQNFILLLHDLQILRRQGGGIVGSADHRLHAQLGKAQIGHVEHVVGEVRV